MFGADDVRPMYASLRLWHDTLASDVLDLKFVFWSNKIPLYVCLVTHRLVYDNFSLGNSEISTYSVPWSCCPVSLLCPMPDVR